MGRKHRLAPDNQLVQAHAAGSVVTLIQLAEHARLGTVAYVWPKHWAYHYNAASEAFDDLGQLHNVLETLPVSRDGMRTVSDIDLLGRVYDAGTRLVVSAVLTVQHLCEEIERWTGIQPTGSTIEHRLASAGAAAVLGSIREGAGYSAFQELKQRRDAVEHPREENVYAVDGTTWDRVPLAWFLSDRALGAFETYQNWISGIIEVWEAKKANWPQTPVTLDVAMRGIRSIHQFKKPPDDEAGADS